MADDLSERMALAVSDATQDGTFETGDIGGEGTTSEPETPETPEADGNSDGATALPADTKVEEKPATEEKVVEKGEAEDELFKELGLKPRPDKKENRIPYSRVKAITESQKKKQQADFDAKVKDYNEKVTAYEARLTKIGEVEHIIANDPARYAEVLATINPKYKELFAKPGAAAVVAPVVADTPPQPNVKLADGSMTYDTDGLQKLMDWQAAQTESRIAKKYDERFSPMEKEWKAKRDYDAFIAQTAPKIQAQLDAAEKWPLFTENNKEILAALTDRTNPAPNLEAAYQRIVLPKLQTNRDTMRAELLKELEKKPTQLGTPAIQVAKTPSEMSLEDSMMAQLKKDGLTK